MTSDNDDAISDVSKVSVTSSVHDVLAGARVTLLTLKVDSVSAVTSLAADNTKHTAKTSSIFSNTAYSELCGCNETQYTVERVFFMTLIDGAFCLRTSAVHRPEPRFGRCA